MTKRITTMSLCAIIFTLLFACGGRNSKSLSGYYKVTSLIVEGYGDVSDIIKNEGRTGYFTFYADGTYDIEFDGERHEGKWDKKYIYGLNGDEKSAYTYDNGQVTIIIDEYNSMGLTRLSD